MLTCLAYFVLAPDGAQGAGHINLN